MRSFLFAWKCSDCKWSCWIRYGIFIVPFRNELANLISRMLFYKSEGSLDIERLSLSVIVRVKVSHWPFYPEEDSMHHNTRWFLFQVGEHEIECQPGFRLVETLVLPSLGRMRFSVFLSAIRKFALLVCKSIIVVARLVMATTFPCQGVPASIAAYVNVVEFSQSRDGLEEMFLDRFLRLEKPRMQDTRTQVVDVSQEINGFFFLSNSS